MNKGEIRAYAAALIDGEGTIKIRRKLTPKGGVRYFPFVKAVNTNREVLTFLKYNFGGAVTSIYDAHPRHSRVFVWYIQKEGARCFLRAIRPYLIIKREHAVLVLSAPKGITGKRMMPAIRQRLEETHRKLTILNRRGRKAEQLLMELRTEEQLRFPID